MKHFSKTLSVFLTLFLLVSCGDNITPLPTPPTPLPTPPTPPVVDEKCKGNFEISGDDTLKNLEKIKDCTTITGDLKIYKTEGIEDLSPLSNLQTIKGNLYVQQSNLANLKGLEKLSFIEKDLEVRANLLLTDLTGLNNITSIEGSLVVDLNPTLTSLQGLEKLSSINGNLKIRNNPTLTSLKGLDNLVEVKGKEGDIYKLSINNNKKFDCTPYNTNPPKYFPPNQSQDNKVNCKSVLFP